MSNAKNKTPRSTTQKLLFLSIGLTIITILSSALIVILSIFYSSTISNNTLVYLLPATLTLISLIITSLFIGFFKQKKENTPQLTDTIAYPPPPPYFDSVEVIRKEIVDEYLLDGKTMLQRKRLILRILNEELDHFKDRFRWTGKGKYDIHSLTPGFTVTEVYKEEEDVWDYFDVRFPRVMYKEEKVDFTIEWKLVDEGKTAVPFLSTMIDRETKYLLLQVNLPEELAPKRAYFHEYANYIDTLPIYTEAINWSPATKSLTYEITHPKLYHKYSIRWYNQ